MTSVLSEFVRLRAECGFESNKMKEKWLQNLKIQSKIQTFSGLTTFKQDKKTNQLSNFWTKEKSLEIIDLHTKN